MKRKRIISILLLLGMLLSQAPYIQITAAKKKKVEYYYKSYVVQSKKNYRIRDVINIKYKGKLDPYEKEDKKKLTNPKIKWKSNDKQIKINKNKFTAKKSGTYKLMGRLETKKKVSKITIELRVYDKELAAIPEKVSKITISRWGNTITVTEPQKINMFRQKYDSAQYRLDINVSNRLLIGWEYWVRIYSGDGKLVCNFTILDSRIISVFRGGEYRSTANNTVTEYVEELFNKYYVPEAKEG
ncbi:MAG: hypothetical protein HFJ06_03425 [Lachnospiraceae bacterium]|nr:hypothetical protein [Lachnospiraceae bacterium]